MVDVSDYYLKLEKYAYVHRPCFDNSLRFVKSLLHTISLKQQRCAGAIIIIIASQEQKRGKNRKPTFLRILQ